MTVQIEFEPLALADLPTLSAQRKDDQYRFVQILAVNTEAGIDLIYSFMKDGVLVNSKILAVQKDDVVPSITDRFLEAFVFENEIHDLFGVTFKDIAIDFAGHFYDLAQSEPMTIISPEQKAARDKARKAAAAKAAKQAKADKPASSDADLEAKLAGMDPEKAAKVRAAMRAREKRAAEKAGE